jgi:hypothetical protein
MRSWTEKDVENLIRNSAFPNRGHKARLRGRLLEPAVELYPEDLDAAAGGVRLSAPEPEEARSAPMENADRKTMI